MAPSSAANSVQLTPLQSLSIWLLGMMLFGSGLKVHMGFDWYLSYLMFAAGFGLLLVAFNQVRIVLWPAAVMLGYLGFCLFWTAIHSPTLLFSASVPQVLGISVFCGGFIMFFATVPLSPRELFEKYVEGATVVALLGFPIMLYTIVTRSFFRLQSVFAEPSFYAIVMLPALYYSIVTFKENRRRCFIQMFAMLLTASSVGLIGMALFPLLLPAKSWWRKLVAVAVGATFVAGAYFSSPDVATRVDDTVNATETGDLDGSNYSTFALLANMFVAEKALQESPVFGNGIGSHADSHERYLYIFKNLSDQTSGALNLNYNDANSLMLRVLSEQGLFGAALVLLFVVHYFARGHDRIASINHAIFIYLMVKLLRSGHYFSAEMYFFVLLYYLTGRRASKYPTTDLKARLTFGPMRLEGEHS